MANPSSVREVPAVLKKGTWDEEEDRKLFSYIQSHGAQNWDNVAKNAELNRDGKSCRFRWKNYLDPDLRRVAFDEEEDDEIIRCHGEFGNKWADIAKRLPAGRTANDIKNYWNTHLAKRLLRMGIDPETHLPLVPVLSGLIDNPSAPNGSLGYTSSNNNTINGYGMYPSIGFPSTHQLPNCTALNQQNNQDYSGIIHNPNAPNGGLGYTINNNNTINSYGMCPSIGFPNTQLPNCTALIQQTMPHLLPSSPSLDYNNYMIWETPNDNNHINQDYSGLIHTNGGLGYTINNNNTINSYGMCPSIGFPNTQLPNCTALNQQTIPHLFPSSSLDYNNNMICETLNANNQTNSSLHSLIDISPSTEPLIAANQIENNTNATNGAWHRCLNPYNS